MAKIEYNYKVIGKLWNEHIDGILIKDLAEREGVHKGTLSSWFSKYLKERANKGLNK